ncbi:MAG: hypothetical protein ACJ0HT_04470 [Alphaproteobacteria bacterium]
MIDPVEHAKAYPFPAPDYSYLFEAGKWSALENDEFDVRGRTPVLAAGSNQSPEQLAESILTCQRSAPFRWLGGIYLILTWSTLRI